MDTKSCYRMPDVPENDEFALLIDDRLVEKGVYAGESLRDKAFQKLIKKQFLDVVEISDGGNL